MLNHHDKPQNSVSGDEMLKHFNMDHTMLANPNVFPHKPKFDLVCRRPRGMESAQSRRPGNAGHQARKAKRHRRWGSGAELALLPPRGCPKASQLPVALPHSPTCLPILRIN
jgi:hypothetical protein